VAFSVGLPVEMIKDEQLINYTALIRFDGKLK